MSPSSQMYKGILNMLNGKNKPRAVRGFCMASSDLVITAMIDALHLDDTAKKIRRCHDLYLRGGK